MWLNYIVKFVTHYLNVTAILCWIFSHIWIWNVWQLKSKFETLVTYEFKSDKYMSHTLTVWPNVIYGHTFTFIAQMLYNISQIFISPSHIFPVPAHLFSPKSNIFTTTANFFSPKSNLHIFIFFYQILHHILNFSPKKHTQIFHLFLTHTTPNLILPSSLTSLGHSPLSQLSIDFLLFMWPVTMDC